MMLRSNKKFDDAPTNVYSMPAIDEPNGPNDEDPMPDSGGN